MVLIPHCKNSRKTTVSNKRDTRITFFSNLIEKLQQQQQESFLKAQATRKEETEARRVWQQQQEQEHQQAIWKSYKQAAGMKPGDKDNQNKAIKLQPCLPLQDHEVIDVDKTSFVSFSLKVKPNGNSDSIYKKTVKRFSDGSPSNWIQTIQDIKEIWGQNKVTTGPDRAAIVKTILRDDALTVFVASIEAQTEPVEGSATATTLTADKVEQALKAVSSSVFPHRALENQKLWMRRHMKKPQGMSYRILQAKVLKMNRNLVLFPEATEESKFNSTELLEILEFALPAKWRAKFNLDGYIPSKHDRGKLLAECEAIERHEGLGSYNAKPPVKKDNKRHGKKEDKMGNKVKFCTKHSFNTTHDTAGCWLLHPSLKPAKFKQTPSKGKALSVLLKDKSKEELLNMVLESTQASAVPIKGKAAKKKTKTKRTVTAVETSESSDESVQHMECATPEASETEDFSDVETKRIPKKKRIQKLGQATD